MNFFFFNFSAYLDHLIRINIVILLLIVFLSYEIVILCSPFLCCGIAINRVRQHRRIFLIRTCERRFYL